MGCHIVDPLFWALKLKYPVSVEANISKYWHAFFEQTQAEERDVSALHHRALQVPRAREGMPEVELTWWDGGLMPARPAGLEPGRRMGDDDGGILLIGDKGAIMAGCYGESPRIVPESGMKKYKRPPSDPGAHPGRARRSRAGLDPRLQGRQARELELRVLRPLVGDGPDGQPRRSGSPTGELLWNGEAMEVTNDKDANAYVRREYREGFPLPTGA